MFQKLVSHNPDLNRLVEKGYAVAFDTNCLIVRDIPYLNGKGELKRGAIVTKLVFENQTKVRQEDHQIFFAGGVPHGADGKPIPNLGGGVTSFPLSAACKDIVVERSFSNKPIKTGAFVDFFAKIESYVTIISGPAMERDGRDVSPFTFNISQSGIESSVFKIHDTLTSKAEIVDLADNFRSDVIAIIGLGGTGGYVLDFLVKSTVLEVRGYDLDGYFVHNVFRSPGKFEESELRMCKAAMYQARYENLRHGLKCQSKYIDETSLDELEGVTFAFVCVDTGSARAGIFDILLKKKIPFIDVGMGLARQSGAISGLLRTTFYSSEDGQRTRERGLAPLTDGGENLYRTNIQIAELNALNASLAVIKYKQLRGFYADRQAPFHTLFDVADLSIVGEHAAE